MFDRLNVHRATCLLAPLSLALLVGACGNEPAAPTQPTDAAEPAEVAQQANAGEGEGENSKSANTAKMKAGDNAEVEARELTIEAISGGWRVARVEGAKPGSETANMKGAIAEIYPESARWSYKPKGAGALNDFCQEPVPGIVRTAGAQRAVKDRFAKSGQRIADKAVAHELMCASGGAFGDSDGAGTDIALIKPGTMAMTWDDGTVLILEQINRPDAKETMKPEDYRATDYNQ